MNDADPIAFPSGNTGWDGLVLDMALDWFVRQTELNLDRRPLQIETGRVPGGEAFHELVVQAEGNHAIALEAKFLAGAVQPEDETNARFFGRHAVPGGSP